MPIWLGATFVWLLLLQACIVSRPVWVDRGSDLLSEYGKRTFLGVGYTPARTGDTLTRQRAATRARRQIVGMLDRFASRLVRAYLLEMDPQAPLDGVRTSGFVSMSDVDGAVALDTWSDTVRDRTYVAVELTLEQALGVLRAKPDFRDRDIQRWLNKHAVDEFEALAAELGTGG